MSARCFAVSADARRCGRQPVSSSSWICLPRIPCILSASSESRSPRTPTYYYDVRKHTPAARPPSSSHLSSISSSRFPKCIVSCHTTCQNRAKKHKLQTTTQIMDLRHKECVKDLYTPCKKSLHLIWKTPAAEGSLYNSSTLISPFIATYMMMSAREWAFSLAMMFFLCEMAVVRLMLRRSATSLLM